jgi:flavin reductase (DIM6/NTAB) family NADH-FMN oxidoreductase RutF
MELDLRGDVPDGTYRTVTSAVVPRPIGWISTRTSEGVDNLAPYSYFNAVSSRPPVVMFSAGRHDGQRKDSPTNAIQSGEFVHNLVTEDVHEAMDETSASLPPEESEFDAAGIERAPSVAVDAPRVADAILSFECELYDSMAVYDNTVVLGEVVYVHADESILTDGKLDSRKIDAVGRLGGPYYTSLDITDFRRQY